MKDGSDSACGGSAAGALASGGVRVDAVDVAGLCGEGLRARLGVLARAESRLAAMKADALGEIARRNGDGAAAHAATDAMAVSGRKARGEVRDAVRLGGLDATREGLSAGSVPVGHAQLIARAAGDAPIDDEFLAERARHEGYDEFRRTVARHVADVNRDDGASLLERQRRARSAKILTRNSDGMTVLNLVVDPLTGARLGTVIAAAERRLFKDEDPAARRTPQQRMADAISQLICDPDTKRPAGASLIVVADYDMVNHQLTNGRLADGTPIPIGEIAKIAVDAEVLPAIFDAATGDLRMGRTRRTATDLQRAALALRDKGCVGCGISPERCQHHHIDHWQHGGHTDYTNLVTVCPNCHNDKIHQQGFTVEWDTAGSRYRLQPPTQPPNSSNDPSRAPPR
ncbi:HNH endonuclease [Candidatus Poriferisodalis sp.]|uniref:HNH endonuclease signature motif containing protein n=1 Tax=Candidatus Poriferisodalis sp. TaxID=3101277 RepID=UPI003B52E5A5